MTQNLSTTALPEEVQQGHYSRDKLRPRIVHLGFGAFHRAHQALVLDRLLESEQECDWGYCEVNLFGGEQLIRDLRAQDHRYSVMEMGAEQNTTRIIGSVCASLHPALDGSEAILEQLASAQTAIVSMTITEKGYCLSSETHKLDTANPLIVSDLEHPGSPQSAVGYIVESLRRRRERALGGFTLMSCDNLPQNGVLTRQMVLDYAAKLDTKLAGWIDKEVSFPSTMVDRIVPAITEESLERLTEALGVNDPCGIACEPFLQWVIEDRFVAGRPQWEKAGAQLVENVLPFEEMKLRMLNGSHSFLAYLGYLGGYQTIAETMTDSSYKDAAYHLMLNEQAPTLTLPEGVSSRDYADRLIERYSNPALKHRTWQIAMDGSQKLPQRMLESVQCHLERGTEYPCLALGIAGWMFYVSGRDELGQPIDVRDPLAAELKTICDRCGRDAIVVRELVKLSGVFPATLASNAEFIQAITESYQQLLERGARGAIAQLISHKEGAL
ncbi:mannitol dehydrogenase family protein [Dongshaea marina]|uniref:mannitol dehydrogenase family protein n=1 Tax=Dongshaea marina TaxID=2047966 RepID=UPI000D3E51E5|nr:fructuronate reductase [Dongshaea marina]